MASKYVSPVPPGTQVMRQDQGQDYMGKPGDSVVAIGRAHVDAIKQDPEGFGIAIYYTLLDGPAKGTQIYVGHTQPVVQPGQVVQAGQPVSTLVSPSLGNANNLSGWAEIGIASGGVPTYPAPIGGNKFDQLIKRARVDDFVKNPQGTQTPPQGPQPSANPIPALQLGGATAPAAIGNIPNAPVAQPQLQGGSPLAGSDLGQLEPPELTQPQLLMPGQGAIADQLTGGGQDTSRLWDLIQQEQNLTPDTIAYAQNVSLGA